MAWHIYNNNSTLKTGDIIETSASKWFLVHFGVIFFKDGVEYITHCPLKEGRPVIETLEEFKTKRIIFRYFRSSLTQEYTDKYILKRAESLQRFQYDVASFNCEDYVKNIIEGVKLGVDLRIAIAATIIVTIVLIITLVKIFRR